MPSHASQTGSAGRGSGLRVVRAATADALAADLAAAFSGSSSPGPLERCVIAVQGPGLGRWLRADMARRLGAWGGVETPFLRGFLMELACQGTDDRAPRGREDLDGLAFRVAATLMAASRGEGPLPPAAATRVLAMIRREGDPLDHVALLRVSRRLADAFDRYEVDRPELVTAWQEGRSGLAGDAAPSLLELESWQRPLWQATAAASPSHRAWARLRQLVDRMERGSPPPSTRLPAMLGVFGVSILSPFLVRSLVAMARHTQVVVHMLSPTRAFLAERATRRQLLWRAAEAGWSEAEMADAAHMPAGHSLLDAMGRQASQAERVLLDLDVDLDVDLEGDAGPEGRPRVGTVLQRLQQDLLEDRPAGDDAPAADGSVQVHSVTTSHRAAEVAHDAVLAAFGDIPGLRPERVAILTPDIAGAGHAVESVFAQHGILHLSSADRRLARAGSLMVALGQALSSVTEGLTMGRLQATLGQPGVLARLRLRAESASRWLDRLEQAGARRFLDREDRAHRLGRPPAPDDRIHTLQWAVDRVVLGLAVQAEADPLDMAPTGGSLPAVDPDLLPSAGSGSADLEELHEVVQAIESIAEFVRASDATRSVQDWSGLLLRLAERLLPGVDHPEFGRERRQVSEGLERLSLAAVEGGFHEPLDFASVRELLESAIADAREGTHFASGGITLARLSPMRSVPFDVLVLVGLDLGVFPRSGESDGVDLVAAAPRAGDQLPRQEDLQLFLESVHAARRRLVVVHRGVDPRTGDLRPPSPAVDQLLDACVAGCGEQEAAARLRESLVTVHPPRSDQPEAWLGDRPPSFDAAARHRAEHAASGRRRPVERDFLAGAVLEPRVPETMHGWLKALREPAEALLDRLGLRMPDTEGLLSESDELVRTGPLEDWKRRESCARAVFRGLGAQAWRRALRLGGGLPHGHTGEELADDTLAEVALAKESLAELAARQGWPGEVRTASSDHVLPLRGRHLSVQVERLVDAPVQVLWYPGGRRHHLVGLWIRHLVWSVVSPGSCSVVIALGQKRPQVRAAVDAVRAAARLERLLDFGAAATCLPMPLMPRAIMACDPDATPDDRRRKVRDALQGGLGHRGVMQDPANGIVFESEPWGPGGSVRLGEASLPVGLDGIAAEIRQAMTEDGWLSR